MLTIDQGLAVERFTNLKDFAVPVTPEGCRLEAEHRGHHQFMSARLPAPHAHPPVLDDTLRLAARAALSVQHAEERSILHEVPRRCRLRLCLPVCRMVVFLSGGFWRCW